MASPRPFLLALTSTLFASSVVAQTETPEFARDVLPIFETSCTICHGAELTESQLRLDSEAAVLEGGVSGAVVSPGAKIPDRSLVFGVPGKIAGEVKAHQIKRLERGNRSYLAMFEQYKKDGI